LPYRLKNHGLQCDRPLDFDDANQFLGTIHFALPAFWFGIKCTLNHGLLFSPLRIAPVKNMLLPDLELG